MTMQVRIFKKTTPPTQSGPMLKNQWVLEYETTSPRRPESLMGWTSSQDTLNQVRMAFASQDEAIAYAQKNKWRYVLSLTSEKRIVPRNYSDNFKYTGPAVKETSANTSATKKADDKKADAKKSEPKKDAAKKVATQKISAKKPAAKKPAATKAAAPKAKPAAKAKAASKAATKPKAKTTKKTDAK